MKENWKTNFLSEIHLKLSKRSLFFNIFRNFSFLNRTLGLRKSFLNQTTYVLKNRLYQQSFLNRDSFLNRAFLNRELTVLSWVLLFLSNWAQCVMLNFNQNESSNKLNFSIQRHSYLWIFGNFWSNEID